MTGLVCYCFEYTEEDIRKDFETKGFSTILEKMTTKVGGERTSAEVAEKMTMMRVVEKEEEAWKPATILILMHDCLIL